MDSALVTALSAIVVAVVALGRDLWRDRPAMLKEGQEAGAISDDRIAGLQDRLDLMWAERNECRKELENTRLREQRFEARICRLEAEVVRLGGDPKTINGGE